jgi:hypothetical protein
MCRANGPGEGGLRKATAMEMTRATTLYRLWGGAAVQKGGFWTAKRYSRGAATLRALAVCDVWPDGSKSPMNKSVRRSRAVTPRSSSPARSALVAEVHVQIL